MTEETKDFTEEKSEVEQTEELQEPKKTISEEELLKRISDLESTNSRLLEESKHYKLQKNKVLEEKLLAEGKKDEAIKSLNDRLAEYEEKEQIEKISIAVAQEAKRRNCPHWNHMFNATNPDIYIDPETRQVVGIKEWFDACESDDELKFIFFKSPERVKTDNRTPDLIESSINYKTDPMAYLLKVRKDSPDKYDQEFRRLVKEGIIV